jgi:hypothetical protein
VIHGNTLFRPVFLEGGVKSEWYLQLFNDAFQTILDEMPLTVRCWFYFQHEGAPPHLTGEMQDWSSSWAIDWVQRNNQMVNKIHGPHAPRYVPPWSSKVPCVLHPPMLPLTLKKISMLLLQTSHLRL